MVDIGRLGVWTFALRSLSGGELADAVGVLEGAGYGALWFPGGSPAGAAAHARGVLGCSSRLAVATGIVSIWAGDPPEIAAAARELDREHPGRFLLGLGASHPELVDRDVPGRYAHPVDAVARFLDALDAADPGADARARVLAALGPRMLRLAGQRTAGAHPYFVPVEHTAFAREVLGPGALLAPEQAVVLEPDPTQARAVARQHMQVYLGLRNYTANLRRFGFTDDDLAAGGSDRLVDAVVAWGPLERVAERVRSHFDAGADHVCLQVLTATQGALPLAEWRELAGALA